MDVLKLAGETDANMSVTQTARRPAVPGRVSPAELREELLMSRLAHSRAALAAQSFQSTLFRPSWVASCRNPPGYDESEHASWNRAAPALHTTHLVRVFPCSSDRVPGTRLRYSSALALQQLPYKPGPAPLSDKDRPDCLTAVTRTVPHAGSATYIADGAR